MAINSPTNDTQTHVLLKELDAKDFLNYPNTICPNSLCLHLVINHNNIATLCPALWLNAHIKEKVMDSHLQNDYLDLDFHLN